MTKTALLAHPSTERYGSDRMLLASAEALLDAGWNVVVALPEPGALASLLTQLGAKLVFVPFPVLRKSSLTPMGVSRIAGTSISCLPRLLRIIRRLQPDLVYVNTVTVPAWIVAARLSGVRTLCHVHEAESAAPSLLGRAVLQPLLLTDHVVVNSEAAGGLVRAAFPHADVQVVYNGIPTPPSATPVVTPTGRVRLVLPGRLSHRKGTDIAITALALLLRRGRDVELLLAGDTVPGHEWYREHLRQIARSEGVPEDRLQFLGFQTDIWQVLEKAHVVIVPSRIEPFGNVAVEAMLAGRPVVASRMQGLTEIIDSEDVGALCDVDDPIALAAAVEHALDHWEATVARAEVAQVRARERFGADRYASELLLAVEA